MRGRIILAGSLALAGGLTAAIGSFLPWAEVSAGPFSERASGIGGWEGKVAVLAGISMLLAGVGVFRERTDAMSRIRTRALLGGLVATGVGIYTAVTSEDQLIDAAVGSDLTPADVADALESGLLVLSLEVGLYLVLAGGALGIVAAMLAFTVRAPASTVSGSGLTGWAAPAPPSPSAATGASPSPWPAPPPADPAPELEPPPP